MKNIYPLILLLFYSLQINAQQWEVRYEQESTGQKIQKNTHLLIATKEVALISDLKKKENNYPIENYYIKNGVIISEAKLNAKKHIYAIDSLSLNRTNFTLHNETKKILGYLCKKASIVINSNHITIWYTNDLPIKGGPNTLGNMLGLVLEYERNGSFKITANSIEKKKKITIKNPFKKEINFEDALSYRDLIWQSKFTSIPIFKNELVNFDDQNKSNDSILKFANGTILLKKVRLPKLTSNHQIFVDAKVQSNGDAYDRTGSVFLIDPSEKEHFLKGLENGIEHLPKYRIASGDEYQGIVQTEEYVPATELMRFFTSFGIGHYNKIQLKNKEWYNSVDYRQDITELSPILNDKEVYIGIFIGNYDKGGHLVNLNITIHNDGMNVFKNTKAITLFNTTNIMEMAGQNYATLFKDNEGLKMSFFLDKPLKNVQLRYIVTGHGGWENGDEFVPKLSNVSIDKTTNVITLPWRVDCGSYRLFNPASGNFDNGLSSSDLSRSNWCPGTLTNPIYIPIKDLEDGWHTLQITIPQGASEGGSFSAWNVSGVLLGN